jgi:hypothetical protein
LTLLEQIEHGLSSPLLLAGQLSNRGADLSSDQLYAEGVLFSILLWQGVTLDTYMRKPREHKGVVTEQHGDPAPHTELAVHCFSRGLS